MFGGGVGGSGLEGVCVGVLGIWGFGPYQARQGSGERMGSQGRHSGKDGGKIPSTAERRWKWARKLLQMKRLVKDLQKKACMHTINDDHWNSVANKWEAKAFDPDATYVRESCGCVPHMPQD